LTCFSNKKKQINKHNFFSRLFKPKSIQEIKNKLNLKRIRAIIIKNRKNGMITPGIESID